MTTPIADNPSATPEITSTPATNSTPATVSPPAGRPRFSVVIATYNRRNLVLETVQSVKDQTYPAHEIIVVVDGCRDDTTSALRAAYPDVIIFEQQNLGRSVARNSGIAVATGDWVCFIDDDDLWHREKLELTAKHIAENPDCQAVTNPVWFFSETQDGPDTGFGFKRDFVAKDLSECHREAARVGVSINSWEYLKILGNSFKLLLERNRGVMSASVVRRDTIIRAGCFCPMQAYGDDWTMFVNVARLCEWHTLPQALGFTRLHRSQSTLEGYNAIYTLAGILNAWYGGRPLQGHVLGQEVLRELEKYGPVYREAIQDSFWSAIRRGQFGLARLIRSAGRMLLPRATDRLYTLVPPQITWRWERAFMGMHR